jgi:hypothetical protein
VGKTLLIMPVFLFFGTLNLFFWADHLLRFDRTLNQFRLHSREFFKSKQTIDPLSSITQVQIQATVITRGPTYRAALASGQRGPTTQRLIAPEYPPLDQASRAAPLQTRLCDRV